jgi:hypothetical protein
MDSKNKNKKVGEWFRMIIRVRKTVLGGFVGRCGEKVAYGESMQEVFEIMLCRCWGGK